MVKEEILLRNRAGKRMPAILRKPDGASKGSALVLHGLGGWQNNTVVVAAAEELARLGYATLTFDCADGAAAPDGEFENSTNTGYLHDVEDVVAWMEQQEWHSASFIIAGHSQGGLVALRYAYDHQEQIQRLILLAPAVAWYSGLWMYWWQIIAWLLLGKLPWQGPPGKKLFLKRSWLFDFLHFDGYLYARSITIPTLVVAAEKENTVARPFVLKGFAQKFKNGSYACIRKAGHTFWEHEQEVADTISAWHTSSSD